MLENTFLHAPGIGVKTEQRLWDSGVRNWHDFAGDGVARLSPSRTDAVSASLRESSHHVTAGDPRYFSERLPANQHWRFFPEFRGSTVYLDIETTGLSPWNSEITTIALYNGQSILYYVNGQNLDDFLSEIHRYSVIISYNGRSFDVPFIESYFRTTLGQAHIDLRYVLASLGYTGGLKACEAQLGLGRGDLAGIDGYFAVLLWYDYVRNDNARALETLLAYNIQDTVNLERLMVMAYNMKISDTPFYQDRLPEPVLPLIPCHADMRTVNRIRREHGF